MVPKSKIISIFKKVVNQTRKGNIEWRELDPGVFIADVSNSSLRIEMSSFGVYDNRDNLLDELNPSDLRGEADDLATLFDCARKSSLKVYEKLNELERTLDGIL
jgi:hypothetical protein